MTHNPKVGGSNTIPVATCGLNVVNNRKKRKQHTSTVHNEQQIKENK
jgi:hypothetical protein